MAIRCQDARSGRRISHCPGFFGASIGRSAAATYPTPSRPGSRTLDMVRSFTQSEQAANPVALAEPGCIVAGQRLAGPQIETSRHAAHTDCNPRTSQHCSQVAMHPPRSSCAKTVAKQQTWLTTERPMSRVLESVGNLTTLTGSRTDLVGNQRDVPALRQARLAAHGQPLPEQSKRGQVDQPTRCPHWSFVTMDRTCLMRYGPAKRVSTKDCA